MKSVLNISIKWKIICILLLVSVFTFILACSIFVVNDLRMFKSNMLRNLDVLAEAVGKNNQAALRFEDTDAALQILSSLEAEPQVYYAALYTSRGERFIEFIPSQIKHLNGRKGTSSNSLSELFRENVEIRQPIYLKDKKIGEILIKAELSEYRELLTTYMLLSLYIFATVLVLSFAISIRLQSIISAPILNLADTTKRLSQEHDYSIRVSHNAEDEIGTLYSSFNEMLLQIDKRDIELDNYKTDLEDKVRTRTSQLSEANDELSKYNKKLNQEIKEREKAEEDLKSSLDEKDILLAEIHHRVKNNLQIISSLLRLQSNHTSNTESKEIFSECSQRIESMALLYEKIYGSLNLSEIELEEYLKDLVNGLLIAYGIKNKSISININTNSVSLDIDSIVPCSLIMQELISNSLKHAFPNGSKGKIDVSLKRFDFNGDKIELQVVDNGIGLSADWDLRKTETLGLQLVKRLSEDQLKGSISVDKKEGAGFTIIFPLKESYHGTIEV